MSDLAEYVEKQQSHRTFPGRAQSVEPTDSGYSTQSTLTEDHAELDIIDSLNLSEVSAQVRLKDLLLDASDSAEVTLQQLGNELGTRLLEGHGEALFDLGQEYNGETMAFSKEQWDLALDRIRRAASFLNADCRMLLTRNVGGPQEAETINEKEKGASGKLLIRRAPKTIEDVIETRIAVVGNGMTIFQLLQHGADRLSSGRWEKYHARSPRKGRAGRWAWESTGQSIPAQARDGKWANQLRWNGDHGVRCPW